MTLLDENWDYNIELFESEKKNYKDFEQRLKALSDNILHLLDFNFVNKLGSHANGTLTFDWDLNSLLEKNKQLIEEIDMKATEIKDYKEECFKLKEDKKLLSLEIKDTHEAFLMAKKYYKKHLKIYYTVESEKDGVQKIFVQFFTETRKATDDYSLRLLRDTKTSKYELEDVTPRLSTFKEIQKKLFETNDVPSALCCIRQSFVMMKQSK